MTVVLWLSEMVTVELDVLSETLVVGVTVTTVVETDVVDGIVLVEVQVDVVPGPMELVTTVVLLLSGRVTVVDEVLSVNPALLEEVAVVVITVEIVVLLVDGGTS
jgi:hypothetical protein